MENCSGTLNGEYMSLETSATPWSHDELQLIGAELGDTVDFVNESGQSNCGVIVLLNKMTIYVLTEQNEIVKFGRMTLMSLDNQWEIIGLSKKQLRISASVWKDARNKINSTLKKADK